MGAAQRYMIQHGAYTWSLIAGQANANAMPTMTSNTTALEMLKGACSSDSGYQKEPHLFGLRVKDNKPSQLIQDVAFFLLARGDYAWLGWGQWGMTWPFNPEPAHGTVPPLPHGYPRPAELDVDYGSPLGLCSETSHGIFSREFTHASVQLNTLTFEATITMK